jgi:hypothetical protein
MKSSYESKENDLLYQHSRLSGGFFEVLQWHQAIEFAFTTQRR